VHVELHSNDLKKARDFYSKLFGWKLEDVTMPQGGSYTMISVGEGTGGGMMVNQAPPAPRRTGWPMSASTTLAHRPRKPASWAQP